MDDLSLTILQSIKAREKGNCKCCGVEVRYKHFHTKIFKNQKIIADIDWSICKGYDTHPMSVYLENLSDDDTIKLLNDLFFGLRHMKTEFSKKDDKLELTANGYTSECYTHQVIDFNVDMQISMAYPINFKPLDRR